MKPVLSSEVTRVMLLVILIGLLIVGSFWTLLPFVGALLWATTIVVATWPLLLKAQRAMGGRRSLAAAVMTLVVTLAVVVPIFLIAHSLLEATRQAPSVVNEFFTQGLDPPPDWVAKVPVVGNKIATRWAELSAGGPEALYDAVRPYA